MKILNANIPTDRWFIRILSKYSLYLVILLGILIKTYFWLNSTEQKKVSIGIDSAFLKNEFIFISLDLGKGCFIMGEDKPLYSATSDIIKIEGHFNISTNDSTTLPYYTVENPNFDINPDAKEILFFSKTPPLNNNTDTIIPRVVQPLPTSFFKTNDNLDYYLSPTISINVISDNTKFVTGGPFTYDVNRANYDDSLHYDDHRDKYSRILKTKSEVLFQNGMRQVNNLSKKYYYNFCDSTEVNGSLQETFWGDFFTSQKSIIFTEINFHFTDIQYLNNDSLYTNITFNYEDTPLSIISISPEPDFRTANSFGYSNRNSISKEGYGIQFSIYAEDLNKKDRNSKLNFLIASLIGILFSVLAEIGVKYFERKNTHSKIENSEFSNTTKNKENLTVNAEIKKKSSRKKRKK